MRIKLDENLPLSLVGSLGDMGHDVEHVFTEGLAGHEDPDVWSAAQAEGRLLITQDVRFADTRMFTPGLHHGLVLVRVKKPSFQALRAVITSAFATGEDWSGCFVVVTPRKVRVRRQNRS